MRSIISAASVTLLTASIAVAQASSVVCRADARAHRLPRDIAETSGLALSQRLPGLVWTHNDRGNQPLLFALDSSFAVVGSVTITGAAITDWEDLETGACAAGQCIYLADIGDNDGKRAHVSIHELPEPDRLGGSVQVARTHNLRYPDRPQDAEAMVRTPDGRLYIVTKGRHGPIRLYRTPLNTASSGIATLELVSEIGPQPRNQRDFVTGAALSPDGNWVALRTYADVRFFPAATFLRGEAVVPAIADVSALKQQQGEGIALGDHGVLWLSSEAESKDAHPSIGRLTCELRP